jgi:hypothetical protein
MPTESNLLCGRCGRFLTVTRNGITVEEMDEANAPYKLWAADLWGCPECDAQIIAGFGTRPLAEAWQPGYADQRARRYAIFPGRCRKVPGA